MDEGIVKKILQESDLQYAKASEESSQEWWRTHKALNFDKTWTNVYRNWFKRTIKT